MRVTYNPRKDAEAILNGPMKRKNFTVETREEIEAVLVKVASLIAKKLQPNATIIVEEKFYQTPKQREIKCASGS
jgi:hypothetical protein